MQQPPPPPDDDLEPTIAMPRVTPPPPPRRIDDAVVEPVRTEPAVVEPAVVEPAVVEPAVFRPAEPVRVSPAAPVAPPVAATVIPAPTTTVVAEPPRYVFGHPLGYVVARFAAFFLDVALVSVFITSLAYSLIAINPLTGLPTNSQRGFDATFALGIAIALVYVWVSEAFFGTTIWKLAFGLHVYSTRGRVVGLAHALVRGLLRPIDLLVVGGVLALLPGHRRLGDLLGGTVVARSPLRAFAPLVGWILIIILCGLPFVIAGPIHTTASLFAFAEFVPGLIARLWLMVQSVLNNVGMPH